MSGKTIFLLSQSDGRCATQISNQLRRASWRYFRAASLALWRCRYAPARGYSARSTGAARPSASTCGYKTAFFGGIALQRLAS